METKTLARSTLTTWIAPLAIAIWASLHGTPALAGPAELIRVDFDAPVDHPFVSMRQTPKSTP